MEHGNVASTFPLEIGIKCANLCLFDGETNLNPVCVMYRRYERNKSKSHNNVTSTIGWSEIGRTEKLASNKDPDWKRKIEFDYTFGENIQVKFEVYHTLDNSDWGLQGCSGMDSGSNSQELIGKFETPLCTLLTSQEGKYSTSLALHGMSEDWIKTLGDTSLPKIHFETKEKNAIREIVRFELRAENLDDKDLMGKSDPYLIMSSQASNGQLTQVYKSEVIKDNLNPKWRPFKVEMMKVCNGDYNKRIKIQVYDYDSIGSHDYIGHFVTTMNQLQNNLPNELKFPITNEDKKGDNKGSGSVFVVQRDIEVIPTFIKLLQTGTKINLSIAFDFTESNGDPSDKSSLHYACDLGTDSPYSFTARSVVNGISSFSSNQTISSYGFGAKLPQQNNTSSIFPMNMNGPNFSGLDALLESYKKCVKECTFSGPCKLSPTINHIAKQVQTSMVDSEQYFVLLILTNGEVHDIEATKSALSSVSDWPLSIVIVGVGNRDFSMFDELKADYRHPSALKGRNPKSGITIASRSNHHFVELRKHMPSDSLQNHSMMSRNNFQKYVAMEILSHVPAQFADWMSKHGKNTQTTNL